MDARGASAWTLITHPPSTTLAPVEIRLEKGHRHSQWSAGTIMPGMKGRTDPRTPGLGIAFSAAVLMAYHGASRATRDTLFLTHFELHWLPLMAAIASLLSIPAAIYASARMATSGPRPLVPVTFGLSAALLVVEWWLVVHRPAVGAIVFFTHIAVFGPVLVSGFWSILYGGFDPRTARLAIGRISALATIGGLAGFLLAERITAWFGLPATMLALAVANVSCVWSTARMPDSTSTRTMPGPHEERTSSLDHGRALFRVPHLRNMAFIVLGASVSAAMLDLLFKAHAREHSRGSLDLMRVFLGFNGLVTLGTFAMQLSFTRLAAGRAGLVRTIGALPVTVLISGLTAAFVSSPWFIALVRGSEAVMHGSVFRGGYELLYAGLPKAQRQSVRTLIDVGCDRLGDVVGYGAFAFVLYYLPSGSSRIMLLLAAVVAGITLLVVLQLARGHVASLADSLEARAGELASLSSLQFAMGATGVTDPESDPVGPPSGSRIPAGDVREGAEAGGAPDRPKDADPVPAVNLPPSRLDASRVHETILSLGNHGGGREAMEALIPVADQHMGQLIDALLDSDGDLAMRCGIVRILSTLPYPRAVEGLTHGLMDHQFEVRSRCATALAHLMELESTLPMNRELMFDAVRWEAQLGHQTWAALDARDSHRSPGHLDAFLRERAERSLEHVFTLLSLVLPRTPLMLALRGLRGDDPALRGTALEYLDGVLPPAVREALRSVLEAAPPGPGARG